jgi:hypothetical protein
MTKLEDLAPNAAVRGVLPDALVMSFLEQEKAGLAGTSKAVLRTPKRRADGRMDEKTGFEMIAPRRAFQHCRENLRRRRTW